MYSSFRYKHEMYSSLSINMHMCMLLVIPASMIHVRYCIVYMDNLPIIQKEKLWALNTYDRKDDRTRQEY